MSWSSGDRTLVTCADDGSLYEWDISNYGHRSNESVIKSCSYNDVTLTEETGGKKKATAAAEQQHPQLVTYAVGSDKTIKEVKKTNYQYHC